jgi:prepilin-type N-terminal cleavage/methylation domain-containing protein
MKKSKGFTLIELLGVITLLGLILAIVIPKATASIEKARQNSAADSGLSYIKATRDYYNANVLDSNLTLKSGKNYIKDINDTIDFKGNKPLSGYITISNDKIVYAKLCVNYYEIIYQNSDVIVSGTCTGEEDTSQYTSYVEGAAKAYIYIAPGYFNAESDVLNAPPIYALIIYVDELNNVLSAHWGYVFYTVDTTVINNYITNINEAIETMPLPFSIDVSHFYVLEELSIIYLIENNAYMTATSGLVVDYGAPLETVLANLKSTLFGGEISTTVYKTIEF